MHCLQLIGLLIWGCFFPIFAANNHSNQVDVHIMNAFSIENKGGNPAGVVLNSEDLSKTQKQEIAKQVGTSATAFVSKPDNPKNDYKLEFFTSTSQIPHCGHATIATFNYLVQTGVIKKSSLTKETIDGSRRLFVKENKAFMELFAPRYENPLTILSLKDLSKALNLSQSALIMNPQPTIVSLGNKFLIIGVNSPEMLQKIKPNLPLIKEMSERFNLIAFYVFSLGSHGIEARMFGPRYGIDEESASGTAAASLGCYLYDKYNIKKTAFEIEQGRYMPNPSVSRIYVTLKTNHKRIVSAQVGGSAHYIKSVKIDKEIPRTTG